MRSTASTYFLGRGVEFKVMVRPLKAIGLLQRLMAERLGG